SGCTAAARSVSARTSISTSKWPALARMAPSRITARWSELITSTEPVTVTNTSPNGAASHRQHPEPAQRRVQRSHRVDLGDDYVRAEAAGVLGHPAAAGPEPGHHDGLA